MAHPKEVLQESIRVLENRRDELLRELDNLSLQLKNEKAQYSQFLNEDLPIYKLPNELLADIFMDCQQNTWRSWSSKGHLQTPFQVTVSHVSRRWRETVLSTPLLWNTLNFQVRPMNHVQGRAFKSQLEAHLTRSDTCFLDIALNFHVVDALSTYFKLLVAHSKRWRRLSIVTRYEPIGEIGELLRCAETPLLQHLSLNLGKPEEGALSPRKPYITVASTVLMSGAPLLSFVRLAGFALGNLHPPTTSVTTLHLDGWTRHYMTHDQFQLIFKNAPCLVNLSLNQLCIHHSRDPLEVLQPSDLPNLRCLRVHGPRSPVSRLISLIHMPQLHSLSLHSVDTFDSAVIPSVQRLFLDSCAFDEPEIGNLIRAFPSVSFLSIDEAMPDIYSMLLPDTEPEPEPANENSCPWPHLRTLAVRELESVDVPHLCNMVFMRRNGPGALTKIHLDRRSRTVLRAKHRLDWLQDQLAVENTDVPESWPVGLGYEDVHDLWE